MQSKRKSNSVVTHDVAQADAGNVEITFRVLGAGAVTLQMVRMSEVNVNRAAVHGMIQRISDRAAIGRDPETGASATPQEKLAAMQALVDHYHTGTSEWSMVAKGEGAQRGLLFQALCIAYPNRKPEEIREWLGKRSKAEQAKLRQSEKIAVIIAELQPDTGEADEMLSELEE